MPDFFPVVVFINRYIKNSISYFYTFMMYINEERNQFGTILFHQSGLSAISNAYGYVIVGHF